MQAYTIEKVVGEGSFGKALLCRRNVDRRRVIIKQISIAKMSNKDAMRTELEATLLSRLKHPNIVAFIDSFRSSSNLHIVMEYADGGDLDAHIKSRKGKLMSEKEVLHMFVQMALAIKHIHDRKILHRDLKSQNIFLTSTGIVKLGDFGVSRVLEKTLDLAATQVGTPYYMPPEICNNTKYNSKCDIWSLGVILFELMTLGMPFKGSSMQQLLRNIASQPVPPVSTSLYSHELRQMLESMLHKNYSRRPGINAVLQAPVVTSRIANYLDENVKQQEFSHTVLHGAHILRGRPAAAVAAGPGAAAASPPASAKPVTPMSAAAAAPPSSQQRREDIEKERQLKEREEARRLQRAAEDRQRERLSERDREKAQHAALQAVREREKERERERERDVERARERLAAEKKAIELSRLRAQEREREKERLVEREREKERALRERERARDRERERAKERADKERADKERDQVLREKALEADRQIRLRREAKEREEERFRGEGTPGKAEEKDRVTGLVDQAAAAAAALQARRQANLQAFEREREERTKQLRARLKGQLGLPAGGVLKIKEKEREKEREREREKDREKLEAKEEQLRVEQAAADNDSTSTDDSSDLRMLGPPPARLTPGSGGKGAPASADKADKADKGGKPKLALADLEVGDEWLSQLEQRMGQLKGQVKKLQANSPRSVGGLKTPSPGAVGQSNRNPSPGSRAGGGPTPSSAGNKLALRKPSTPSSNHVPAPSPSPSPSTPNLLGIAGRGVGLNRPKPPLPSPMLRPKKSPAVTPTSNIPGGGVVVKRERDKVKVKDKDMDEVDERDKEERRREREALRENRRIELKAYVQAQREAKGDSASPIEGNRLQPLAASPSLSPRGGNAGSAEEIQSVFKFIVANPASPRGGKETPKEGKADRPGSARSIRSDRSDKKKEEPRDRMQIVADREKRSDALRQAILAKKKQTNERGGEDGGGIEIFTPLNPLVAPRHKSSSPSSLSPRSSREYSQLDIDIARAAEAEARVYVGLKDKMPAPASIHDLDLDEDDDDDDDDGDEEGDISQIADLCDDFDFVALRTVDDEAGGGPVLDNFNTTQRMIFGGGAAAATSPRTNGSDEPESHVERGRDAESEARHMHETSSASADYHALMQKMQEVLAGPSRVLDSGEAAVEASMQAAIKNGDANGALSSPLFDDDTFEEDEENYILLGTPGKLTDTADSPEGLRDVDKKDGTAPLSPISLAATMALAADSVFHGSVDDGDGGESPPPAYSLAVSTAESDQQSPQQQQAAKLSVVVDDIADTPSKGAGHREYLQQFLSDLFGPDKLAAALALLRQTLVRSPRADQQALEEEEELLLGKLEEVLGCEGLAHLDDMFYLVSSDERVSAQTMR